MSSLYGRIINEEQIIVTSAAMNGMMMLSETIINPGDNIVAVTPVWPNFFRCIEIMSGEVRMNPLSPREDGWNLELDKLLEICDHRTRAIYVNSPNNPTGWVMKPCRNGSTAGILSQKTYLDYIRRGLCQSYL